MDLDTAAQIAMASLPVGITPIVRVPGKEHHHASRILDAGAQGIVVPHVDTRRGSAARGRVLQVPAGRPPLGDGRAAAVRLSRRAGRRSAAHRERGDARHRHARDAGRRSRTPTRSPRCRASTCVLIGTNDLCAELGIPGQFGDAQVEDAYRTVIAACRKHGKHPGMGGVYEPEAHGEIHRLRHALHPERRRPELPHGGRARAREPAARRQAMKRRILCGDPCSPCATARTMLPARRAPAAGAGGSPRGFSIEQQQDALNLRLQQSLRARQHDLAPADAGRLEPAPAPAAPGTASARSRSRSSAIAR